MNGKSGTLYTLDVSRDGYSLHAEAITPTRDNAPWIVCGNSLLTDRSIWDAQTAALAGDYGFLRYDQAGHGKSGLPPRPINFDDLGADLLAVMDAAGVKQAIYIGLSMGVPTGLAAHKIAANRFAALVFSDGQAATAPGGAAAWDERIEGARASGMDAFATATTDRWLTKQTDAATRQRLSQMIAATPFEGFEICATALKGYDYTDALARISCPTLLIAGAQDGAIPQGMATKLQPSIALSEMHIIEGAGHVPCFEQPNAFTAILSRFLETRCGAITA